MVLGVMRDFEGSCLFNGDPRRSKTDHRDWILEGAEEAWGVIFEVVGGYWGFCGG